MSRKDLIGNVLTGVLVVCALVMTAVVVRREFFQPAAPAASALAEVRETDRWDELTASEGHWDGPADAPVRIVEFSDFQCRFCASVQPTLDAVREKYGDRVSVAYRHFPLDAIHPHARGAGLAVECAGEQGRFKAYHDALFARQDSIGTTGWDAFARAAAVPDLAAFDACLAEGRWNDRVAAHLGLGEAVGVRATPTLVVNGRILAGAVPLADLERVIDGALD
jgi:protein-disulfide isomerase